MIMKSRDFQFEIRLGLALIILVLVILNIAAHYSLFRVKNSVEGEVREELNEAAVMTATKIDSLSAGVIERIRMDYGLEDLSIIHLSYDRVIEIHEKRSLDEELKRLDSTLTAEELAPVLMNKPVYRHKSGQQKSMVLYPVQHAGSKYLVCVTKQDALLGSLENVGRILVFVSLLGILVIIFASLKLVQIVIYPFRRLKEKAEKSGHLDRSTDDEVSQLISSYEKIIDSLKDKEKELIRLNEIITRRADDLEVYNNYILKSIQTGIITLDARKRISTFNQTAAKMLGLSDSDVYGADHLFLFRGYPELLNVIEQFFADGMAINNREVRLMTGENEPLILSISISLLSDSQGNNIGASIILNDQTESVKLQEELEQRRRLALLGEMSGGLAHQLRNSIAAIVGFVRLIDRKTRGDDNLKRNIDHLLKESMEAEELVARFLDFARPLAIEATEFYITELLNEIVASSKEKYSGVEFEIDSGQDRPLTMWGDPLLLKQAIGNMVDNACKAFENGKGKVTVRVDSGDRGLEIQVIDNGPGIPDNYKDKIFTPFFSGSSSGHGLGLSLARKIISLHDGHIDFESSVGKGTIFRITLPPTGIENQTKKASEVPASVS